MKCRNCGDVIDPQRAELGYDYCTKSECQSRCMKRVELASVGVNKAADQFVRAEEVRIPTIQAGPYSSFDDDEAEAGEVAVTRTERPRTHPRKSRENGHDRLRRAEVRLDQALEDSYERFRRGEITVRAMNIERNRSIRAFNALVRAENIRYRSMLRREFPD